MKKSNIYILHISYCLAKKKCICIHSIYIHTYMRTHIYLSGNTRNSLSCVIVFQTTETAITSFEPYRY